MGEDAGVNKVMCDIVVGFGGIFRDSMELPCCTLKLNTQLGADLGRVTVRPDESAA